MMRGKVSNNQNKLVRLIKAPIRILSKARDSYVRSWGDSTQSVCYSRATATSSYGNRSHQRDALPRSFSTSVVSHNSSRVSDQQGDDFRELVRVASVRTLMRTVEMEMMEERRAKRFGKRQQQPNGMSRSASVAIGMGRIDEACEFVEEEDHVNNKKKTTMMKKNVADVGKKQGMLYPRSRSHAVGNTSSLMMMYVGVGDAEETQLFYYFIKSETNPAEDPLLIWFSGGPGCSSFTGLVYQIGPLKFQVVKYNGSVPSLVLNPFSWTKHSSIIFLDLPIGAGFSYSRSQDISGQSGDLVSSYQAQLFLRKWLVDHPEFQSNPVYIAGDSYSGLTVPIVTLDISDGNDNGFEPFINLKGYILGNPVTRYEFENNFKIPFAYGMGLISDELYESLKRNCKGEYMNVDSSNSACLNAVQAYDNCTYHINVFQILEPDCPRDSPSPFHSGRPFSNDEFLRLQSDDPDIPVNCRTYGYLLSSYWANDENVQKALQVRKGTITGKWKRCNYGLPYEFDDYDSFRYHVNLSCKGYRSLIYSGDHDLVVTFLGTQAWIRDLNYTIIDDWRPWIVEGEIAGYTRTYSNSMTFATVKGAGHTAPEYMPEQCFSMFKRWSSKQPL